MTVEELANVIHEAAFKEIFSLQATRDAMARANGRKHLHVLEEALTTARERQRGPEEPQREALPLPTGAVRTPHALVNTRLNGEEVDFHWPEAMLAVEVDGSGHTRSRTTREDQLKQRLWEQAGLQLVRFTEADITPARTTSSTNSEVFEDPAHPPEAPRTQVGRRDEQLQVPPSPTVKPSRSS